MNYRATFGIDYGVSYGLDIKFPDYQETEKILIADNDFKALLMSAGQALKLSREYPNNPKTNFTTITIIEMHNEKNHLINQKEILKKWGYANIEKFKWDEKNRLFTGYSKLEHLLIIKLRKKISIHNISLN